ncbi:MAG: hypothetical protein AB1544_05735 [Pseudomonadota bacterium]|jgi:hypothetical protein
MTRHIEVIYCDDIREEVGNKLSYMGVYSGELHVQAAPVVLTKLSIAVKVVTDFADPFKELEVRVLKGEDDSELLTTGPLPTPPNLEDIPGSGSKFMVAQMAFFLAPFQIDGETILKVKARTEREELVGMALRILVTPQQPNSTEKLH